MPAFSVEFGPKVEKDLRLLKSDSEARKLITEVENELSNNPWPFGKLKKKIKGMRYPLFRLRIDTHRDSFRAFYILDGQKVLVLRIVSKKQADRIIDSLE